MFGFTNIFKGNGSSTSITIGVHVRSPGKRYSGLNLQLHELRANSELGGFPLHKIAGQKVGVFAGQSFSTYAVNLFRDLDTIPMFQTTGCADSLLSNRISYLFDLRGPSATVDTACSSSLSALHLACQSLRSGESDQAIVGSCHLLTTPDEFVSMSAAR